MQRNLVADNFSPTCYNARMPATLTQPTSLPATPAKRGPKPKPRDQLKTRLVVFARPHDHVRIRAYVASLYACNKAHAQP